MRLEVGAVAHTEAVHLQSVVVDVSRRRRLWWLETPPLSPSPFRDPGRAMSAAVVARARQAARLRRRVPARRRPLRGLVRARRDGGRRHLLQGTSRRGGRNGMEWKWERSAMRCNAMRRDDGGMRWWRTPAPTRFKAREWNATECNGVERHGMPWRAPAPTRIKAREWNATECNGMQRNLTERNAVEGAGIPGSFQGAHERV